MRRFWHLLGTGVDSACISGKDAGGNCNHGELAIASQVSSVGRDGEVSWSSGEVQHGLKQQIDWQVGWTHRRWRALMKPIIG